MCSNSDLYGASSKESVIDEVLIKGYDEQIETHEMEPSRILLFQMLTTHATCVLRMLQDEIQNPLHVLKSFIVKDFFVVLSKCI